MTPAPTTASKPRRPPTFSKFPENRARKLKEAWVQKAKIKSQWKAEKRKLGIQSGPSATTSTPDYIEHEPPTHSRPGKEKEPKQQHRKTVQTEPEPTLPPTPQRSLREMHQEAYSSASLHTFKAKPLQSKPARGHGRGQPNMKLRMGAMLEKIKREYT